MPAAAASLRAKRRQTVFALVWISPWTTAAGTGPIGATSWLDWLLAPVFLVIGPAGLGLLA